mmetsp:Transcript_26509/g.84042  ORF Transcript_26509/g.84042 Transcript_26509/m.84042 type:complete len:160 (+) Transcript_26509:2-481(+)
MAASGFASGRLQPASACAEPNGEGLGQGTGRQQAPGRQPKAAWAAAPSWAPGSHWKGRKKVVPWLASRPTDMGLQAPGGGWLDVCPENSSGELRAPSWFEPCLEEEVFETEHDTEPLTSRPTPRVRRLAFASWPTSLASFTRIVEDLLVRGPSPATANV